MSTKDEIIAKIKNFAEENNGETPGETAFQNKTGIGRYDWGRYWPKWGDAVREAGLTPNEPWTRVPDDFLTEKMIEKIRQYGKYPTLPELRIEKENDSNFPYTIIKKRKKEYIIRKIIEYCNEKDGYEDVLNLCQPTFEKYKEQEKSSDIGKNKVVGEVYLYKSGHHYKIGKTSDTVRRGSEIRMQLPEKPSLIHSIKTDDPSGVEIYWHKRFEEKRGNGEWFKLNFDDIKVFKRWKKIY